MAPKRKRRASPVPKGLATGELLRRFMLPSSAATPWSWVGSEIKEPGDITHEHRLAVYGFSSKSGFPACKNKYASRSRKATSPPIEDDGDVIIISDDDENPQCSKKLCRNNPRCLNYLGQDRWEDEDKALALFNKFKQDKEDPMLLSRDPDTPVGLKNLGATCYANSSIQVWFRDLAFRNGVYKCRMPEGTQEEFKEFPIFNLQVTFAALQEGKQSVYNPSRLVESLQLRTAEQQDAQEFSKLFMSHLDAEFKKQSDPAVRDLVASQFQGSQVYGTICHTCKYSSERSSDFLEIEVNIKANSRLEDRIKDSLQPEILSKDNQYFCPQCNSLQDATRYTELRQLPPVLHFSLLRFVYDLSTMERKKSKHSITFPTVLDMGQFIGKRDMNGAATQSTESVIYELRGILLHKGNSAYHGHYEAQVYDTQMGSWFQFNDEDVTKISLFGDKSRGNKADADASAEREKSRKNSRKRRRIVDSDEEESPQKAEPDPTEHTISSKDAYMLVYMRKDAVENSQPDILTPQPPSLALRVVEQLNDAHERSCEEYEKQMMTMKAEFERRRLAVMEIYHTWHLNASKEGHIVICQEALQDWLSKYCSEQSLVHNPDPDCKVTSRLISNAKILCPHKKLDPDKASDMKVISQNAYSAILRETQCQFDPLMQVVDVCEECVASRFHDRLYDIEHPRIVKDFDAVQVAENDSLTGYWISKSWLKDWKLQRPRMHEAVVGDPPPDGPGFVENVTCAHGGLTPNHTSRKKISKEAKDILQGLFPSWDPPSTEVDPCVVCQDSISLSKEDKRELRRKAEEEKARLKHMNNMAFRYFSSSIADESCALIPTNFYTSWKRWVDGPTSHTRPEAIVTDALLCSHSRLLYDPNCREDMDTFITLIRRDEWETLSSFYPTGPLILLRRNGSGNMENAFTDLDPAICSDCQTERKMNWESTEIIVQLTSAGKRSSSEVHSGTIGSSSTRQSRRLRNKQEGRRKVKITKFTTVKDLKIEISEVFDIPTICQRLFFRGRELIDNEATAQTLEILVNDILYLEQISEAMDIDSDSEPAACGKPRDEGQGFNGTILGGAVTDSSRASSRAETPVGSFPLDKSCKACTFVNPMEALSCEMCDTIFE